MFNSQWLHLPMKQARSTNIWLFDCLTMNSLVRIVRFITTLLVEWKSKIIGQTYNGESHLAYYGIAVNISSLYHINAQNIKYYIMHCLKHQKKHRLISSIWLQLYCTPSTLYEAIEIYILTHVLIPSLLGQLSDPMTHRFI